MATLTKTIQAELKAISAVAAGAIDKSSELAVATHLAALLFIDFAPDGTGTPTVGTKVLVQASEKVSGDDTWRDVDVRQTGAAAANSSAVDGTENAGATVIEESATTGIAVDEIVFFKNGTLGNSEWSRVWKVTTNTSFELVDGLTNAQTGSTWFSKCFQFVVPLDLTAIKRLRVVCLNNMGATNIAIHWRAAIITADSIG